MCLSAMVDRLDRLELLLKQSVVGQTSEIIHHREALQDLKGLLDVRVAREDANTGLHAFKDRDQYVDADVARHRHHLMALTASEGDARERNRPLGFETRLAAELPP